MTREQKLSLIMGFVLVLAVSVLLTDHFSGANRGQSASPEVMGDSTEINRDYGEPPIMRLNTGLQMAQAGARGGGEAIAERVEQAAHSDDFKTWVNGMHAAAQREAKTPERPEVPVIEMGAPTDALADRTAPPTPDHAAHLTTYTVQKNDTLWGIAQKFYGDGALHKKLAKFNEGRTGKDGSLYAGATLLIPPAGELGGSAPTRTASAPVKPAPSKKAGATRYYTVQKNDTLSQIAQRELGTVKRMDDILSLNREKIDSPDDIWVGLRLKLPST